MRDGCRHTERAQCGEIALGSEESVEPVEESPGEADGGVRRRVPPGGGGVDEKHSITPRLVEDRMPFAKDELAKVAWSGL